MRDTWMAMCLIGIAVTSIGWIMAVRRHDRLADRVVMAEYAATHDHLTGLPNRRAWSQWAPTVVGDAKAVGHSVAVLLIDLDDFKTINDRWGHSVGDRVLEVVAHRLTRTLPERTLVCRIGGDEFAAIITGPQSPDDWARTTAEALRDEIASPAVIGGRELRVQSSIGVTAVDSQSPSALLDLADAAMYRQKKRNVGVTAGITDIHRLTNMCTGPWQAQSYEPRHQSH
ncbi:MAG: GGDEF domain-containing protein [Aldersonia sp.]|nr:GGDEF domain-containing protein [Aldersonia sp.]